jgi:hypothetical protein
LKTFRVAVYGKSVFRLPPELNTVELIYPSKEQCCQKELGFRLDDVVKLVEEKLA